MMHEARDRQKFFSDVQYLRDMQHKMDFEYQACLRRQENRRDEKKRDQFCGQETGSERSLFSSKASSKQSSGGEESLTEPRPSSRKSEIKCDSKLPAIDQTPVKQKHKSTMSPRKPEQVGPSKTSPEAPKILSRKGRPYLGRLTVSPEMHSLRAAEDRSRQKWQPPAKAPTRWGPDDPVVHQEDSMWAIKTKLKRTTQEKRNFISSSQLMRTAENPAEGTKQVDQNALSLNEPYSALSQTFQRMRNPQVLSGSLGPPLTSTTMGGPRKTPFRFQDKEFYSMLSLNTEGENNNIGEETYTEEEILLVGMQSPCSPSNYKPSTFLGTSATYAKNKNFEENDEHCRGNSLRSKPNGGSLRISNTMEPVTKQFSVGQRMLQDWPDGQSAEENNRRNSGNEKNTFDSCHTKSNSNPDNDLNDENVSGDCISVHDGPGICDYERDCQDYLSDSRNSPNYLISDRPTAPRSSMNSSYNALGSLMHIALSDHVPTDLSASSTLDKEFYSMLSLNTEGENNNIGEETYTEEEILLVGMQSPCSPSNYKPSTFLGTSATYAKNKNFEENDEHCRGNSLRSKPNGGSLRISNTMEPVTKQFSVGQRMLQDWPDGQSAEENNRRNSGNEKNTFDSCHTKSNSNPDNDLNDENVSGDCISVHDGPGICDYERDCQDYLSDSRNSPNYLISDRPTAPRSSMNSSYNALGSLMHIALSDHVPTDLSASSTLGHPLDPRFGVCQQLPPIRSRSPSANTENHNYFPGNSAREFGVRRAEGITLPSQPQGAPLYADLLLNPQGSGSPVDSPPSSLPRGNLQGHWHVLGSLRENVPFTFLVISEFPNQNDNTDCTSVSGFTNGKGAPEKKADPEKLKRLQESLLEEDSEEEGDLCRICQIAGGSPTNPLLEPCSCVGSLRFVHQKCLKKWLKVKITSGADLNAVQTCEMCKQVLLVNLDDFNLTDFYQKHQQSRAQSELMNSGLYLMLLLRLYEQRFAELMSLDYRRIVRERTQGPDSETWKQHAELQAGPESD
ncbi:Putative E3 ubiquitin-protein ligase MARCH10 [Fukomys damarensis]|uniref:RING-type E3 ubiquitin transferase n=1 Tax=Fukomys damarensis TaxID=885580 RepID=A0A091DY38_FUKDA|nr:Putative E3 ubiquitin-protein ligase MARCH10 [Fukomys damarensis]